MNVFKHRLYQETSADHNPFSARGSWPTWGRWAASPCVTECACLRVCVEVWEMCLSTCSPCLSVRFYAFCLAVCMCVGLRSILCVLFICLCVGLCIYARACLCKYVHFVCAYLNNYVHLVVYIHTRVQTDLVLLHVFRRVTRNKIRMTEQPLVGLYDVRRCRMNQRRKR